MVDLAQLAYDASSNVVSLALPGFLWAVLFALAWEHAPFAESLGLDRKVFWLLLPGALLSSFALLPIAPISNDWLSVSLGGALFPLIVGALAFRRVTAPAGHATARFLGVLVVETAAMLVVVLPGSAAAIRALGDSSRLGAHGAAVLLVAVVAIATSVAVALLARTTRAPADARVAFLLALANGVLLLTFAGSMAIPDVGIVESYPYYLLPPIAAGVGAAILAPVVFPTEDGFAIPTAFFAGTVGVVIGADVLNEPPLYGHGAAGLYAIGGAGVLDLVYLSGLLAFATAYLMHALYGRGWTPVGPALPPRPASALLQLREAHRAGVAGDLPRSLRNSVAASHTAAAEARRLFGLGDPDEARPWHGLPVPGWIVSDQANLDGIARRGTTDPREGYRAWLTARWMVYVGHELSRRRFASVGQRAAAFAIDLTVVTAPALLVFAAIAKATSGGFDAVVGSIAFNVAIVGAIALGLLYFALTEALVGTTVGKAALGLAVRDRALHPPDGLAALVRNLPLAPMLTLVSLGGAIALALAVKGIGSAGYTVLGVPVPSGVFAGLGIVAFVAAGVALLGSFGVLAIALTWERQRVGDLWAGTWVVRDATDGPPAGATAPSAPPAPAPSTDRSA